MKLEKHQAEAHAKKVNGLAFISAKVVVVSDSGDVRFDPKSVDDLKDKELFYVKGDEPKKDKK